MFTIYEEYENSPTFKLFAIPNFVSGLASIMDLGTRLIQYNDSNSPEAADIKAIKSDWKAVGIDILAGVREWERVNAWSEE